MKHNVNEFFVHYLISHQAVRKLIPEFMAKNQLAAEGARSFLDFRVLALKECISQNLSDDKVLCPVRALRYYLMPLSHGRFRDDVRVTYAHAGSTL